MKPTLKGQCDRFIENRDVVKSCFSMESSYLYPICAAIITDRDMRADPERLKRCKDLLKAQTGVFSQFRGNPRLAMIALMSVDSNPALRLSNAQQVYDHLKDYFSGSAYLCVAAMVISDLVDPGYYKQMAEHTRHIYGLLKSKHPFLTGAEDSVFSALLAVSKKTDERIVQETEECYRLLKERFSSGNALQSLSHVLALCEGKAEEKCAATVSLFNELKDRGCAYGTGFELPTLGVLAMVPADRQELVQDVLDVDAYLSQKKGYGVFGVGKKQRLMHASMIVTGAHMRHCAAELASSHRALALIAAQQAALCAAIAAASATAITAAT